MAAEVRQARRRRYEERLLRDAALARLDERVVNISGNAAETAKSLAKHVAECSSIQKKVLLGVALTLGWVVAHSPEVAKLAAKIFL